MQSETVWTSPRFRVVRRRWADAAGRPLERDFIEHPGAVAVLPWIDARRICLIRNHRVAVDETLLELPAGTLEPGEDPLAAAQRELAEETGFRAEQWTLLQQFWMSPGILRERMHVYVARGLEAGAARLEPGERIDPHPVAWEQALEMASQGAITDAKTLAAILLWEQRRRAGDA